MIGTRDSLMAIYKDEKPERIVWQPRLTHWLDVNAATGTLPEKYRGMYLEEVCDELGTCPRSSEVWRSGLTTVEGKNVEVWVNRTQDFVITKYVTPKGSLHQVERKTEHGVSLMCVEYLIKDVRDMEVYEYILSQREYKFNWGAYRWGEKRYGDKITPVSGLPRSPITWLNIYLMGMQAATIALWKYQKDVENFFKALEENALKQLEILMDTPIIEFVFDETMHQELVPPSYFKKYVIPYFQKIMPKIHAVGKYGLAHWDGEVKLLLPLVKQTELDGLECLSPKPQAGFTLEELKQNTEGMILRDVIPALLFLPWMNIRDLEEYTQKVLEMFSPRLILGIGDQLPANGDTERVRVVTKIVDEFNKKFE